MAGINWKINNRLFPEINPQDLDLLVSEFKKGKGDIKKDKIRRTVKQMELKEKGSFFVKHIKIKGWDTTLKYLFLPRKILTEWRIMNQLTGLDIGIPYPVALGINRKFGLLREAFLITQSLGEMIDLHKFYKENIKNSLEKETFLKALTAYLRFLHHKGILHQDIHLENIIVPRESIGPLSFFLVDLYKTRIKKHLSEKEKMLNLALLIFYIAEVNLFGPNDQEKFIRLYYSEDDFSEAKLNSITKKIFSQIKKLRDQRFLSWGRKSFRAGKFFNIIKEKGKFLIYRWEFDPKLIPDILKEHERITTSIRGIVHPPGEQLPPAILKTSRKALVTKININEQRFLVKEGRNDALRFSFRFWVARLRNRRSWANSNKLVLKNIPTPRGLALLEEKRWGVWMKSFLIMEYIEGAIPLRSYVQNFTTSSDPEVFQKKRAFISFMARFVRSLHQKGIYHGDLKSDNFLIKEKAENEWECFIVDTDRVYFGKRVSLAHRIKNLAQLNATIARCISPFDRIKFFKDYSEKNQWTRKQRKTIYRRILKICQSRNTEQYGVSFTRKHPRLIGNRSLKTLHINTELTWRGGEQQALYLLEGLNKRGLVTHLICQPKSAILDKARQKNILAFPIRMRGEFDLMAAFKIARKIKKENYDIVHSHTSHAHSLVMWASSLLRKKPVRIVSRRVDFSIFRHNFLGMNRYKYTKGADHIIAVAHEVKNV
ncbi:MAG TPA: lipopolysaccharide kinase InaA family protein, partial [Thermodesulfobacteriota bacterium]|nr:lipopolysaccharide kinase InaA family protein [Thermodesulfobacteriota bacterium]